MASAKARSVRLMVAIASSRRASRPQSRRRRKPERRPRAPRPPWRGRCRRRPRAPPRLRRSRPGNRSRGRRAPRAAARPRCWSPRDRARSRRRRDGQSGSASTPPPQPTSRIVKPSRGRGLVGSRPKRVQAVSRMYASRTGLSLCRARIGPAGPTSRAPCGRSGRPRAGRRSWQGGRRSWSFLPSYLRGWRTRPEGRAGGGRRVTPKDRLVSASRLMCIPADFFYVDRR